MTLLRLILGIFLLILPLAFVYILDGTRSIDPTFDLLFYGFWIFATLIGIVWLIFLARLKKKGKLSKGTVVYETNEENKIDKLVEEMWRRDDFLDDVLGTPGTPLSHTRVDED